MTGKSIIDSFKEVEQFINGTEEPVILSGESMIYNQAIELLKNLEEEELDIIDKLSKIHSLQTSSVYGYSHLILVLLEQNKLLKRTLETLAIKGL
tara:strand:- start:693 stop:977 length:285 start_codon:yes stop_codon:yes gene_type:complete